MLKENNSWMDDEQKPANPPTFDGLAGFFIEYLAAPNARQIPYVSTVVDGDMFCCFLVAFTSPLKQPTCTSFSTHDGTTIVYV